jgi:hypothetical protein
MTAWRKFLCGAWLAAGLWLPALAAAHHGGKHADDGGADIRGLRDVTVLIVRHAEKPVQGRGLSPQGEQRAAAYASYFDPLRLDGQALLPQRLIATRDSQASARPRLTLTPLAARLQLPIEQPWADDQVDALVTSLRTQNAAAVVLIAWHHGHIDKLIDAFGGKAKALQGRKTWPGDVCNWLVVLRFDHHGKLSEAHSQLVREQLLPGDGG